MLFTIVTVLGLIALFMTSAMGEGEGDQNGVITAKGIILMLQAGVAAAALDPMILATVPVTVLVKTLVTKFVKI
ncbi:MAG: hypothetical protein ACMV1B_03065 [Prevotella sp.]